MICETALFSILLLFEWRIFTYWVFVIYGLYQEDAPKPGQPGQTPRPAGAAAAPRAWSLFRISLFQLFCFCFSLCLVQLLNTTTTIWISFISGCFDFDYILNLCVLFCSNRSMLFSIFPICYFSFLQWSVFVLNRKFYTAITASNKDIPSWESPFHSLKCFTNYSIALDTNALLLEFSLLCSNGSLLLDFLAFTFF